MGHVLEEMEPSLPKDDMKPTAGAMNAKALLKLLEFQGHKNNNIYKWFSVPVCILICAQH